MQPNIIPLTIKLYKGSSSTVKNSQSELEDPKTKKINKLSFFQSISLKFLLKHNQKDHFTIMTLISDHSLQRTYGCHHLKQVNLKRGSIQIKNYRYPQLNSLVALSVHEFFINGFDQRNFARNAAFWDNAKETDKVICKFFKPLMFGIEY